MSKHVFVNYFIPVILIIIVAVLAYVFLWLTPDVNLIKQPQQKTENDECLPDIETHDICIGGQKYKTEKINDQKLTLVATNTKCN